MSKKIDPYEQVLNELAALSHKELLVWYTRGVEIIDKDGDPTGRYRRPNAQEANVVNTILKHNRIEIPYVNDSDLAKTAAQIAYANGDVDKAKKSKQVKDILGQIGVSKQA